LDPFDFEPALYAATAMNGFARPWCVAGGWAIDLWLGQPTRQHENIEVAILRDDQLAMKYYLEDWKFWLIEQGQRRPWRDWQMRMLPVHEIEGLSPQGRSVRFLLNESDGGNWVYHRDFAIRLSLEQWIMRAAFGVPVLAPQIVLLFKSRDRRPKDDLDFRVAADRLEPQQAAWLAEAIGKTDQNHPWLSVLREMVG
jgi:hypothetical protein